MSILKGGERVKLEDIIIPSYMKDVSKRKLKIKTEYLNKYGYLRDVIILDENNVLVDGYSSYVLSKKIGMKTAIIKRVGGKIGKNRE